MIAGVNKKCTMSMVIEAINLEQYFTCFDIEEMLLFKTKVIS